MCGRFIRYSWKSRDKKKEKGTNKKVCIKACKAVIDALSRQKEMESKKSNKRGYFQASVDQVLTKKHKDKRSSYQ
jgi:hypothetical protein